MGGPTEHARAFAPGYTTLVTYEWNGVLEDGTAPAPGAYALCGTLLQSGTQATTEAFVRIAAPLPFVALAKIETQAVTVAGTLDAIGMTLHDASGDVKPARRITGLGAKGTVDVRVRCPSSPTARKPSSSNAGHRPASPNHRARPRTSRRRATIRPRLAYIQVKRVNVYLAVHSAKENPLECNLTLARS